VQACTLAYTCIPPLSKYHSPSVTSAVQSAQHTRAVPPRTLAHQQVSFCVIFCMSCVAAWHTHSTRRIARITWHPLQTCNMHGASVLSSPPRFIRDRTIERVGRAHTLNGLPLLHAPITHEAIHCYLRFSVGGKTFCKWTSITAEVSPTQCCTIPTSLVQMRKRADMPSTQNASAQLHHYVHVVAAGPTIEHSCILHASA
jgi:hypothetical protein